jgi:hypothetical protein
MMSDNAYPFSKVSDFPVVKREVYRKKRRQKSVMKDQCCCARQNVKMSEA